MINMQFQSVRVRAFINVKLSLTHVLSLPWADQSFMLKINSPVSSLTLQAPITTKAVCFVVCLNVLEAIFILTLVNTITERDGLSRRHFQVPFFNWLGCL